MYLRISSILSFTSPGTFIKKNQFFPTQVGIHSSGIFFRNGFHISYDPIVDGLVIVLIKLNLKVSIQLHFTLNEFKVKKNKNGYPRYYRFDYASGLC